MKRKTNTFRWIGVGFVLIALAVSGITHASHIPLPEDDPFYAPLSFDPNNPPAPGTVLQTRPVNIAAVFSSITTPFRAWHIRYASRDSHDAPVADVATLILPSTQAATTPRPLVSYQTAEDSLDMHCAPSYRMREGNEKEEIALPGLLAQGWAVVVPDYEGLESQYTAGIQAGHGVLDGIRAALSFAPFGSGLVLTTPVGMWGYSGGALATAWASELAPSYAPELNIVAVSEGGVPPDITAVAKNLDGQLLFSIVLAGSVGMSRAYPELETLWNDAGRAAAAEIGTMCIENYSGDSDWWFQEMDNYTVTKTAIDVPWVQDILEQNHLGRRAPTAPIFIYQAIFDELIPVADVNEMVDWYCSQGVTVHYYQDFASDHISLAVSGGPLAIANLAARFAGAPTTNSCLVPRVPRSL